MSGKPQNGVTRRLIKFYEENPGEFLSMEDMRAKFGATETNVRDSIKRLRSQGYDIRCKPFFWLEPKAKDSKQCP